MKTCLVTGGAGFIGSNLTERLLERGDRVKVLDNFSSGKRANLDGLSERFPEQLQILDGDIRDFALVTAAMDGVDYVFHQAAVPSVPRSIRDPLTSNNVNIQGTLQVFLAARDAGACRVVFASSSSVYGESPTLPKREDFTPLPISPYALTKWVGEEYARLVHKIYDLEVVSLRYFNVFGPRQDPKSEYAAVIPRFIDKLLTGTSPTIFGDGEQSRDFTFVDNVVEANLRAADAPCVGGQVFNVACGERYTLNELVMKLNQVLGTSLAATHAAPRDGDIKHSLADITSAKARLCYSPSVGFMEGLARTAKWFAEYGPR
ncbi:MAG: SDR family oxidoreductase [Acidobacteria bacterium]|nr:SDR family oxidoreductase [Acidobacteriota bacterium]MBI3656699.1 SDR family oxidoreductase [Acidobacteriota bacterium]